MIFQELTSLNVLEEWSPAEALIARVKDANKDGRIGTLKIKRKNEKTLGLSAH